MKKQRRLIVDFIENKVLFPKTLSTTEADLRFDKDGNVHIFIVNKDGKYNVAYRQLTLNEKTE